MHRIVSNLKFKKAKRGKMVKNYDFCGTEGVRNFKCDMVVALKLQMFPMNGF